MALSRLQCLEEAQINYDRATELSLKNCLRSLEDFIRITSNELLKDKQISILSKEQDILKRGKILMILIPDIRKFKDLYSSMYRYRNKYSHEDNFIPKLDEVNSVLKRAQEFNSFLETEIFPKLERPDTPKDKYVIELQNAKALIAFLENIPGWWKTPKIYPEIRNEFNEFEKRLDNIDIDDEFLNESRIELRLFTVKIENEIKAVEEMVEFEVGMMDAEAMLGR